MFSFLRKGGAVDVVKPVMTMGFKAKLVCNNICILKEIGNLSLAEA